MRKFVRTSIVLFAATAGAACSPQTHNSKFSAPNTNLGSVPAKFSPLKHRSPARGVRQLEHASINHFDKIASCSGNSFKLKDLVVDEIRVSNQDLSTISQSLRVMGYNIIDLQQQGGTAQAQTYTCDDLPVVLSQALPRELKLNFNSPGDSGAYSANSGGGNTVNQVGQSNAGELDSFITYYHPEQREKFDKLNWLVQERLDAPSAQVYIETLVLEVREEDSSEFGVGYTKGDNDTGYSLGAGSAGGGETLSWIKDTFVDPDTGLPQFNAGDGRRLEINALIDEGKAEVLSRPSVLAVSNRQAVIQIVDVLQTPELSSSLAGDGSLQVSSYRFTTLPIGITLNLKPRVSADRNWLTLEIDATVESEDDENSGQVYAINDNGAQVLLSEKQGSSSKKVRTFARIPDRTPIIIGGLVSKAKEQLESKIPFLGNIPALGRLFTSVDDEVQKREVIIVLTPYILDENNIGIASNQPNNFVTNQSTNSILFNDTYRLRNEDLFDLTPLTSNPRVIKLKTQLDYLAKIDPSIKSDNSIKRYIDAPIPGMRHIVNKTLFDIASKTKLSNRVNLDDLILFDENMNQISTNKVIKQLEKGRGLVPFDLTLTDDALVYSRASRSIDVDNNRVIRISNRSDIERLKNAIASAEILRINSGHNTDEAYHLLSPGVTLTLPRFEAKQPISISSDVVTMYNDSIHYYTAIQRTIDIDSKQIDALLNKTS